MEKEYTECLLPISLNKLLRFEKENKETFIILDNLSYVGDIKIN